MLDLTLALIVKNEEAHLPNCLESFAGLWKELLIVDTGSTDKTKEIARRHNARILDFQWIDDFSAARNFTLDQVKTEWVMMIDADDIIEAQDKQSLLTAMSDLIPHHDITILPYIYHGTKQNPLTINYHPKIWRTNLNHRYIRPIHERLDYKPSDNTLNLDIPIVHSKQISQTISSERNLKLLLRHHEQHPADPETLYYICNEYFTLGNFNKAIAYTHKAIQTDIKTNDKITLLNQAGIANMKIGNLAGAVEMFEQATKNNSTIIDPFLFLAEIRLNTNAIPQAIQLLNIARSIKKPPQHTHQSNLKLYDGVADRLLQTALQKLS